MTGRNKYKNLKLKLTVKNIYLFDVIFTDLCGLQFWILRLLALGLSSTLTRLALFNPENTPSVFYINLSTNHLETLMSLKNLKGSFSENGTVKLGNVVTVG
jgi:hypothetical protein